MAVGVPRIEIDRAEKTIHPIAYQGVDLSSMQSVTFRVKGLSELPMPINPEDTTTRLIEFDEAYAASLGSKERDCYVRVVHPDGQVEALRATIMAVGSFV